MTPAEMAALHRVCFHGAPRPWSEEEFASVVSDPLICMAATKDGFVLGRAVADEAEILTLAIDPKARRQGLARRLMQQIERDLLVHKVTKIFLEVAADNLPARALYRNMGFAQVGTRKGYYAGIDALVLSKTL